MTKRRVHGTLKISAGDGPRFTSSCSRLFAQRGDEWLTSREKDREFPLRRSIPADTPNSPEQIKVNEIRRKMRREAHTAKEIKAGEALSAATLKGDAAEMKRLTAEFVFLRETEGNADIDAKPPQHRVNVDPDMDRWTKASQAKEKEPFRDVQGQAIASCPQRKAANALQKMRRGMRESRPIESKDKRARKEVKGGFYKFRSE